MVFFTKGNETHLFLLVIITALTHILYSLNSTGMTGYSCLQIVHPDTGKVLKRVFIDKTMFGEGITVVKGKVYMLTWKSKTMLIFDAQTLEVLQLL